MAPSKDELRGLIDSPIGLRSYCLEHGIGILEAIARIKKILESDEGFRKTTAQRLHSSAKPHYFLPSAVRTVEGVVTTVLRNLQAERFTGEEYTLQTIVGMVDDGIKKNHLERPRITSLRGFVANELYEQVRSMLPRSRGATAGNGKISIVDVRRRLRIDLDRASKEEILGVVPTPFLKEGYIFENGALVYTGASGQDRRFSTLEGTACWESDHKDNARKQLVSFVRNKLSGTGPDTLSYLGLEGPRFGSFLPLAQDFQTRCKKLKGTFVEYDSRSYNLMQSVQKAELSDLLHDSTTLFGDIDDHILLDFAQDEAISIVRRDNGVANALYVKYSTRRGAEFVPIETYQAIIDGIESKKTVRELSRKHKVSEKFVSASSNRSKDKFDVVFLDYVGRITDKRKKAMESILKRRLNDRAIIAATINIASRINPLKSVGTAAQLPNAVFDQVIESSSAAGYSGRDILYLPYRENAGSDAMCFQAYYIEKH